MGPCSGCGSQNCTVGQICSENAAVPPVRYCADQTISCSEMPDLTNAGATLDLTDMLLPDTDVRSCRCGSTLNCMLFANQACT